MMIDFQKCSGPFPIERRGPPRARRETSLLSFPNSLSLRPTLTPLVWLLLFFTACQAKSAKNGISFDGHVWRISKVQSDFRGLDLSLWLPADIVFFETDDPQLRLVSVIRKIEPGDTLPRKSTMFVQKKANGRWVNQGKNFTEWQDGSYGYTTYAGGKLNGPQEEFYPNGQLHIRRFYMNDENNDFDEGWYPDGTKQYESKYVNGKEVSGKFWRQGEHNQ